MPINFPTEISVECDRCAEEKEFDSTIYTGDPETVGVDTSTLMADGWGKLDGEILCDDCLKESSNA